jgi:hypothetical protein
VKDEHILPGRKRTLQVNGKTVTAYPVKPSETATVFRWKKIRKAYTRKGLDQLMKPMLTDKGKELALMFGAENGAVQNTPEIVKEAMDIALKYGWHQRVKFIADQQPAVGIDQLVQAHRYGVALNFAIGQKLWDAAKDICVRGAAHYQGAGNAERAAQYTEAIKGLEGLAAGDRDWQVWAKDWSEDLIVEKREPFRSSSTDAGPKTRWDTIEEECRCAEAEIAMSRHPEVKSRADYLKKRIQVCEEERQDPLEIARYAAYLCKHLGEGGELQAWQEKTLEYILKKGLRLKDGKLERYDDFARAKSILEVARYPVEKLGESPDIRKIAIAAYMAEAGWHWHLPTEKSQALWQKVIETLVKTKRKGKIALAAVLADDKLEPEHSYRVTTCRRARHYAHVARHYVQAEDLTRALHWYKRANDAPAVIGIASHLGDMRTAKRWAARLHRDFRKERSLRGTLASGMLNELFGEQREAMRLYEEAQWYAPVVEIALERCQRRKAGQAFILARKQLEEKGCFFQCAYLSRRMGEEKLAQMYSAIVTNLKKSGEDEEGGDADS